MLQVNIADLNKVLPALVAAAEQGDEVVIAKDGVPIAKIVKYEAPKIKPPGSWSGKVDYSADWNSEATNEQIQQFVVRRAD